MRVSIPPELVSSLGACDLRVTVRGEGIDKYPGMSHVVTPRIYTLSSLTFIIPLLL